MAIIGILAGLLLPAISKATPRARQIVCASNLRQIGIAMHTFAHDHLNRFPQNVPISEGGALEFNRQSPGFGGLYLVNPQAFRAISNELASPHVLICPSGPQTKAQSFARVGFTNLSYFVHLSTSLDQPQSILSGDNNLVLVNARPTNSVGTTGPGMGSEYGWSADRHSNRGNVLLADGSVEQRGSLPAQVRVGRPSTSTTVSPVVQPSLQPSADRSPGVSDRNPAGPADPRGRSGLNASLSPGLASAGAEPPATPPLSPSSTNLALAQAPIQEQQASPEGERRATKTGSEEESAIPWWIWLLLLLALLLGLEIRRRLRSRETSRDG